MDYKKEVLKITDEWSKAFFSKQRDADIEKFVSSLFNKFRYRVEKDDEVSVMFMLLKIIIAEGAMLNGQREIEKPRRNS
jgi:hypothetical protein